MLVISTYSGSIASGFRTTGAATSVSPHSSADPMGHLDAVGSLCLATLACPVACVGLLRTPASLGPGHPWGRTAAGTVGRAQNTPTALESTPLVVVDRKVASAPGAPRQAFSVSAPALALSPPPRLGHARSDNPHAGVGRLHAVLTPWRGPVRWTYPGQPASLRLKHTPFSERPESFYLRAVREQQGLEVQQR
jgi:hypothetical protein